MSILSVKNITVQFRDRKILKDFSLDVEGGESIGVIGPNGCGKTTLLNAISGFVDIKSGDILYEGESIKKLPSYKIAKRGVGRTFQHTGIFEDLSVEENIMVGVERSKDYPWWWSFSSSHRDKMDKTVEDALKEIGLLKLKKQKAGLLSGGEARLLELSRLKLFDGKLLLIDEPTAGVAPALKDHLNELIEFLKKSGFTTIIVEHDLKFLFDIVDRVVVLVEGEKYLEGDKSSVQKDKKLQEIYLGK